MRKFYDLKKRKPHVDSLAIELFERIIKSYRNVKNVEELKVIIIQIGNNLNKLSTIPNTVFKPAKTVFSTKTDSIAIINIVIWKIEYKIFVSGLAEKNNMIIALCLLSRALSITTKFIIKKKKRKFFPSEFFQKGHYLNDILKTHKI